MEIVCRVWRICNLRPCVFSLLLLHKIRHRWVCTNHGVFHLHIDNGDYILATYGNHWLLCCILLHKKNLCLSQNRLKFYVVSVINQRRCNEALSVFIELKYKDYSILKYSLFLSDVNVMYVSLFKMFIIGMNLVKKYIVINCTKISALVYLWVGEIFILCIYISVCVYLYMQL